MFIHPFYNMYATRNGLNVFLIIASEANWRRDRGKFIQNLEKQIPPPPQRKKTTKNKQQN